MHDACLLLWCFPSTCLTGLTAVNNTEGFSSQTIISPPNFNMLLTGTREATTGHIDQEERSEIHLGILLRKECFDAIFECEVKRLRWEITQDVGEVSTPERADALFCGDAGEAVTDSSVPAGENNNYYARWLYGPSVKFHFFKLLWRNPSNSMQNIPKRLKWCMHS